jgi:catechol 2,3-dioxygenase-like lactoylglutathione lyase family enzyme
MFDHIGLRVRDLEESVRFYRAALEPLGHELCAHDAATAGFGAAGAVGLWIALALVDTHERGVHLALAAPDRGAVERFYKQGLAAGGRDNGAPGLRADYGPSYFAAFLVDPDGNNVEAVCLAQEK